MLSIQYIAIRACAMALLASIGVTAVCAQEPQLEKGQSFLLRLAGVPADDQASISQTYTISDTGTIKLLYLEKEMEVNGLRPSELARKIEEAYRQAEIFTKPNITITLGEASGVQRYASILGQVKSPGTVGIIPGLTMLDAIARCGGFNPFANARKVKLTRAGKASYHDLSQTDNKDNIKIKSNDIINVPQRRLFDGRD
ncbi:MAG: SLBB domain-containing protein [Verrucomicrobiales bacterium]|nr:SLBB domain-containing protein [Verrucomicrobiales bacterium]MED5586104.1 SLBB domain-containing protein [Verrucomicrobiota bacterium]